MTDFVEKMLITVAICVFALSYTLRSVEAGSVPPAPKQAKVLVDAPDPIDTSASFDAR